MQLYFIRHAQSDNNALFDATRSDEGRSDDPELTPTGRKQVVYLAEALAAPGQQAYHQGTDRLNLGGYHLTHLYSSPMVRAVATAAAVSRKTGLPVHAWDDLHECGGIYLRDEDTGERVGLPGKTRSYFSENYPEYILPEQGWDQGWWNRPFEEKEDRETRARRVLETLLDRHGGSEDRVAVISHGGFYNHIMGLVLGIPQRNGLWISTYNTSITRVDFEGYRTVLAYTNRINHLPPELVT